MQKEFINIRNVFRRKSPKFSRLIPGFIYRIIEKIIHQNEMNAVLSRTTSLKDAEFVDYVLEKEIKCTISVTGMDNIPISGGAILVSNHPLGGLDGMILMSLASKVRKDVRVIVNDILSEIPNFDEIFIPVNKFGKSAKKSLNLIENAYAAGSLVIIFPAGLCSRRKKGIIRDIEWQKSFISRSKKYNIPVIPLYFDGKNSTLFYTLANIRKFLNIKTNIEMFLLADEMYRQKGKVFKIFVGEPILPEIFENGKKEVEWAAHVRGFVYALETNPKLRFETYLREIRESKASNFA